MTELQLLISVKSAIQNIVTNAAFCRTFLKVGGPLQDFFDEFVDRA